MLISKLTLFKVTKMLTEEKIIMAIGKKNPSEKRYRLYPTSSGFDHDGAQLKILGVSSNFSFSKLDKTSFHFPLVQNAPSQGEEGS